MGRVSRRSALAGVFALLFAARSAWTTFARDGRLVPDTDLYAHGHAWWSSTVAALGGEVAGLDGVRALSIAAAALLPVVVLYGARDERRLVVFAFAVLVVTPPGWVVGHAGADALGAVAALVGYRFGRRSKWSPTQILTIGAVCAFHLVAGLEFAIALAARARRLDAGAAALCAGLVALVGEPSLGAVLGRHADQVQWRYLLPALLLFALYSPAARALVRCPQTEGARGAYTP